MCFSLIYHSHQHDPQLEEIVVFWIFHLHHSPGVQAAPHFLPLGLNLLVGSHHRKWDASLEKRSSSCVCSHGSTTHINNYDTLEQIPTVMG